MIEINSELVKNLINEQFPQWSHLKIRPVSKSGHDNRTFHLGDEMTVRLPSGKDYVAQIEKEITWLPYLQEHLDIPISKPIAIGKPGCNYPFPWSINKYIEGEPLDKHNINSLETFALELSKFLTKFQAINAANGPAAGIHNFYRGGNLSIYHHETINALDTLKDTLDTKQLLSIWNRAINSFADDIKVWVHGDIAPGNLLVKDGKLNAVIDFGILGVGDPACDYAMAWTFFDNKSRHLFLQDLDQKMIARAQGWALWKALITYNNPDNNIADNAKETINEILSEQKTWD